jgi:hypothetical protein
LAVSAQPVIATLIVNNNQQQRFVMTGHKDDSHKKKKKKTRKEDTDEKGVEKRPHLTRSAPESVATPPVVSQTQEEHLQHAPTTAGAITAIVTPMDDMPESPLANNIAIAAGANETGLSQFAEVAIERLELCKDKTANQKAVKLTSVSVFVFLRK